MKTTTVLMIAFSFVAGLGVGLSGPLAKAGEGLLKVMMVRQPAFAPADRITAAASGDYAVFQPADFRWPLEKSTKTAVICGPKDSASPKLITDIQHL